MEKNIAKSDMTERLPAILERIRQNGGRVIRYAGGIWSYPGVKAVAIGRLEWQTSTPFIEELVLTHVMEWTDFHKEGRYKFPRGAQMKKESEGA